MSKLCRECKRETDGELLIPLIWSWDLKRKMKPIYAEDLYCLCFRCFKKLLEVSDE